MADLIDFVKLLTALVSLLTTLIGLSSKRNEKGRRR